VLTDIHENGKSVFFHQTTYICLFSSPQIPISNRRRPDLIAITSTLFGLVQGLIRQGDKLCEFHSNPASDSISFRPSIPLIPAKVSERSDAVFC
jgi:hypothetical protein